MSSGDSGEWEGGRPDSRRDSLRLPRRSLLGTAAGLALAGGVPTTATAGATDVADGTTPTVVTRNLYVGVDLFRFLEAEDMDDVRTIAGRLLREAEAHPYGSRMAAVADEIAATEPDVVCLQEAAMIRTREPSEFDGEHDPGAQDVLVDLLEHLRDHLDGVGPGYRVALETETNDVEVPAVLDGGEREVDVRLTDRVAILVRDGVAADATLSGRFEAALRIPLESETVSIHRGYGAVDLAVDDRTLTVATAHLEAVSGSIRRRQAAELRELLPTDRPVVLAGDLNSGPGGQSGAYEALRESLADAHETVQPDAAGPTCCHAPDLRGRAGELSRRIDMVLYRGDLEPVDVHRVGVDPDGRAEATVDGESVQLWPSDHAGVAATFELAAGSADVTSTGTPTGTNTGTSGGASTQTPGGEPDDQGGLGLLAGLGAAVLAALARVRGRR